MPLAAPLILPFAELAGITIAGLSMAAASQKVSDFIFDNPELSKQILTTLLPGDVGLNILFKDKDTRSTKDIVLGELGKEKGNYSDPDAEGAYASGRGRVIKALEEAGKIKKGPDKDYDPDKKYKGYKKFYEKADGGRVPYQSGGILENVKNIIGQGLDLGADAGKFILGAASGIPFVGAGIGALQNLNQNRFSNLPIGDQLFITEQMGIQGLDDDSGLFKDKYGYNIRSAFGNYADLVKQRAKIAADRQRQGLQQRAIDDYYSNLEKERLAAEAEAQRRAAITTSQMATANRAAGTGGYQSSFGGDSGFMEGSGTAAEMGSFKDGGVITLFVETK